jgi:catechol 2,3-dioxygenase-like lactoylglutathione lyase family enzyme
MADNRNWLIDHTGIGVSEIHRSARFYEAALRPLGMKIVMRISRRFETLADPCADLGGVAYGIDFPTFWIDVFHPHSVKQHTAFRAESRGQVDASMRPPYSQARPTTASPACDRGSIRPATMPRSFSIQMATTSKPCFKKRQTVSNLGFPNYRTTCFKAAPRRTKDAS